MIEFTNTFLKSGLLLTIQVIVGYLSGDTVVR